MPTIYESAKQTDPVHDAVRDTLERYHGELAEAGVTIGVLWAACPGGDAIKHQGYPALALIERTTYRKRVLGQPDAIIEIDRPKYDAMTEPEQLALLDHELNHLVLKRDQDNAVKLDDAGRPKLAMRLHDFQVGWFHKIADRHGEHSQEVQQARRFQEDHGQLYFSWAEGPAPKIRRSR